MIQEEIARHLGLAIALALAGLVVVTVKNRRDRRRVRLSVGQATPLLPLGEFAAWPMRGPWNSSQPGRLILSGDLVSFIAPGRVQPEWQAHADQLGVGVLPPTSWGLAFTRLRLTPPDGATVTVRVSRETRTPLGDFDPRYASRLEDYTRLCINLLRRGGAVLGKP